MEVTAEPIAICVIQVVCIHRPTKDQLAKQSRTIAGCNEANVSSLRGRWCAIVNSTVTGASVKKFFINQKKFLGTAEIEQRGKR